MLEKGNDSALLRYGLGNAYLSDGDVDRALTHLSAAVALDEKHSSAWKLYGKALGDLDRFDEAIRAFDIGIEVAEANGDRQAAKEMQVFKKRVVKRLTAAQ